LAYNLALAKRAKALGLKFYLDFHYSGRWLNLNIREWKKKWYLINLNILFQIYRYLGKSYKR
jgi:arabinogalactan endo-1,4-beta-galactosidase